MVDKYFFACLVFTLVENAACPDPPHGKVGDISLDYYFGLDDTLRSTKFMENCDWRGPHDSCQNRCGSNHACFLGKCFCVGVKPQIKEEDDSTITTTTDKGCSKLFARLRALEALLRRQPKTTKKERKNTSGEDSSFESEENTPKYIQLDGLGMRPTLRHHIAHFCPNLDIARQCIYKCLELGKPAFCGKDHVCYCGHKYGTPKDDEEVSEEFYSPFQDLYERYFGPRIKELPLSANASTTTTTTTLRTTTVETASEASDSSDEDSDGHHSSESENNDSTLADVTFATDPDLIDNIVM